MWLPRGAAPFGARARLIARLAVHARRDARRRPPGEGSRRKGKGGTARGALRVTCSLFAAAAARVFFFSALPRVQTEQRLPVCVSNRLPLHALVALSSADRLDYHQPISSAPPLYAHGSSIDSAHLHCGARLFVSPWAKERERFPRAALRQDFYF